MAEYSCKDCGTIKQYKPSQTLVFLYQENKLKNLGQSDSRLSHDLHHIMVTFNSALYVIMSPRVDYIVWKFSVNQSYTAWIWKKKKKTLQRNSWTPAEFLELNTLQFIIDSETTLI